jgi:hypothetical protein
MVIDKKRMEEIEFISMGLSPVGILNSLRRLRGIGNDEKSVAFKYRASDRSFFLPQMTREIPALFLKDPFIGIMQVPYSNPGPKDSLTCSTSPDHEPGLLLKISALCREHSPPLS